MIQKAAHGGPFRVRYPARSISIGAPVGGSSTRSIPSQALLTPRIHFLKRRNSESRPGVLERPSPI